MAEIHWKGEFHEVVEPERLVFTIFDQPGEEAYELITVIFTDLGDGRRTEMLFQQRGPMSAEQYERAKRGWSSSTASPSTWPTPEPGRTRRRPAMARSGTPP